MAQFLVLAYDGSDPDARTRRQAARPEHFERIKGMVGRGEIIAGAAILATAAT